MTEDSGTILVVDDESEIREIIGLYLTDMGFTVIEACDGEKGVETVRSEHVDMVISDLMMPRMSGMTFLETIRGDGYSIPFIFVTAYPSRDSTVQALRLGAFDYLEKPFDRNHLQNLVREAMRVAKEQRSLTPPPGEPEADETDPTMVEIMKMRTLRYNESPEEPEKTGESSERVVNMFVVEAEPQLLFASSSIKGLRDAEGRVWEIGYLFRVMQAIATAAKAIGCEPVRELADTCQRCYTALRVRPRACSDSVIALLDEANELLRAFVAKLGHEKISLGPHRSLIDRLDELTASLEEPEDYKESA